MTAYVIGAGLAGLSAAVALAGKGMRVEVSQLAGQAGGRCRSYFDAGLGITIDNGNHLVLSGNASTMQYLRSIGAQNALVGPDNANAKFVDLKTGKRWTIKPSDGPIPYWLFDKDARVPGTHTLDYLELGKLLIANSDKTVGESFHARDRYGIACSNRSSSQPSTPSPKSARRRWPRNWCGRPSRKAVVPFVRASPIPHSQPPSSNPQ